MYVRYTVKGREGRKGRESRKGCKRKRMFLIIKALVEICNIPIEAKQIR